MTYYLENKASCIPMGIQIAKNITNFQAFVIQINKETKELYNILLRIRIKISSLVFSLFCSTRTIEFTQILFDL